MDQNKLREKYASEEVDNNWAISYGDMITLLLAFFVLFFNIKTETVNLQLIKKDIDKYFKSSKEGRQPTAVPQSSMKSKAQGVTPIYSADVVNALKVKSNIEGKSILVEFPGIPFFPSTSDKLTPEGKAALADFAKAIGPHLGDFRLVVRGYTDNRPLKRHKFYRDNLELSAFRSISAIRYLHKKGVGLQFMRVAGYGETDLTTERAPDQVRMMDRKVVIVIEPLDQTERVALNEGQVPETSKKPIEEVDSAKISAASKMSSQGTFQALLNESKKTYWKARELASKQVKGLSREISENSIYKKYLRTLIEKELLSKGYSEEQVRQILKSDHKEFVQ